MNCNIIKDLMPLYIDGCCSEESIGLIKEHIDSCPSCKQCLSDMKANYGNAEISAAPVKFKKINEWKASVIQSVLLLISFALITVGVALEAKTPAGSMNGLWAVNIIVPATGFMLSLVNWYFIRLYRNRKVFSLCSLGATLLITAIAYIWSVMHYGRFIFGLGILLTAVLCIVSFVLSYHYAKILGKE